MQNKLHVASTYCVVWCNAPEFYWSSEDFHDLLYYLDIDSCGTASCDSQYPLDFEIEKSNWTMGIEKLRHFADLDPDRQAAIKQVLARLGISRTKMLKIMEVFLRQAGPEWECLEFSFF